MHGRYGKCFGEEHEDKNYFARLEEDNIKMNLNST
jgi:hypothetical protein